MTTQLHVATTYNVEYETITSIDVFNIKDFLINSFEDIYFSEDSLEINKEEFRNFLSKCRNSNTFLQETILKYKLELDEDSLLDILINIYKNTDKRNDFIRIEIF